jgi:hypothetical protein
MLGSSRKAAPAAASSSRRLLQVTVLEADLSSLALSLGKDVFATGSLFRVHDDKEIDKEKGTSPTYSIAKSGAGSPIQMNWEYSFGQTFNLNHETG